MKQTNNGFDWVPDLVAFMRRRWSIVTVSAVITLGAGIGYMAVATPKFTATTEILIDTKVAASFDQKPFNEDAMYANALVESQLEVLRSEGVARAVVRKLNLTKDDAFLANGRNIVGTAIGYVAGLFGSGPPDTEQNRETDAALQLMKMMDVTRTGTSFILDLSVRSTDPNMSANLANNLVTAFIDLGLAAKSDNTRRAGAWMEDRIGPLHDQAVRADRAVQDFKAEANIVETDKGLMNERHLGELNTQLVLARAHTAETKGRLDRIQGMLRSGIAGADVTDALQNMVSIHLREQYVDAARQAADWEAKYGPNHIAVTTAQMRMKDIQTQIQSELARIAAGYESDYASAVTSQKEIESQLNGLVGQSDVTNRDLVTLRALQTTADNYKTLYQNFLQRYTQAVQDESFPISEVQVITPAIPPVRKSHPKSLIVLGASMVLGLSIGFSIAFVRESMDTTLHTSSQGRSVLGLKCFGLLPALKNRRRRFQPVNRAVSGDIGGNVIVDVPTILCQSLAAPGGAFAETLRGLRIRKNQGRPPADQPRVIACVSTTAGEGKSTVSANFAFFLAQIGFRTLLLDGDAHRQTLSRQLARERRAGFSSLAAGVAKLEDVVWHHAESGLDFLPADRDSTQVDLRGDRVRAQLEVLAESYDYVVIDMPAMAAVADVLAAESAIDGYLLVIEWGKTPLAAVKETVAEFAPSKLLGAVLNKVNFRTLPAYAGEGYSATYGTPSTPHAMTVE